jgi:hypothetical protein
MLRATVIVSGCLLLAGSAIALALGAGPGMIGPAIIGLLFVLGTIFERGRYKPKDTATPGDGFLPTGEVFDDPASEGVVDVWFNKTTGQRRYVRRTKPGV